MPRNLYPNVAKGAAGFVLGLVFWWALSVPYASVLASLSEPLIRAGERPPVTRLVRLGTELTIDRSDFPPASPRPGLILMDLTFNVALLGALFAVNNRPLSDRNIAGLLLSVVALVAVHVGAVVANVESIYALKLGPWSAQNYGVVARNFWAAAAHFYTLVGVFGAPFALWWLFRPPAVAAGQASAAHRNRRSGGKRVAARALRS